MIKKNLREVQPESKKVFMASCNKVGLMLTLFYGSLATFLSAQTETTKPLHLSVSYIGEGADNFNGGIKRGSTYLGLVSLKAELNTRMAGWWDGGTLLIEGMNTHGGLPAADLTGDFQGVSNIEAGNHTFLNNLWFAQQIGKINLTAGLQNMDGNFAASEYGSAFINSSFGIPSTFAYNIPSPIFPFTALGLRLEWSLLENLLLKTAVYDGQPDDFESHPYRLNWEISQKEGFLSISEIEWNKSPLKDRNGSYKIGLYYHQSTDSSNIKQKNNGVYLIADQEINQKISAFGQLSVSPKNKNQHYLYAGAGINLKGILTKNSDDLLGFGIAHAALKNFDRKGETAFELTYQYHFNEYFSLQPDLQYILHPAGTGETINNAFVGLLRFYINF